MEAQTADIILALFFLGSLIAVSRYREQLSAEDKGSFGHMSGGLIILTFVTLARIYNNMGVFQNVPFVSDPLFYRLISWIAIITGATLLIGGVTSWLPLSRAYRKYNKDRIDRLDLIKKVAQLVKVETRNPVILKKSLQYMIDLYRIQKGAVYVLSSRTKEMLYVAGAAEADVSTDDLSAIEFDQAVIEGCSEKSNSINPIKRMPASLSAPDVLVPLEVNSRFAGVFVLWSKASSPPVDEDKINLKIAADIIARKIEIARLNLTNRFIRDRNAWQRAVSSALDYRRDIRENLAACVSELKEKVAIDLFSLTIVNDDNYARRYTLGENAGWLTEVGIDLGSSRTVVHTVFHGALPVTIADLGHETAIPVDERMVRGGMKSLAALPVASGGRVEAVAVFASRQPGRFRARELSVIDGFIPILSGLVKEEKHRHDVDLRERRSSVLNGFLADISQTDNLHDVFDRAASILSSELKPTMIRISTFDAEGRFLNSRSLKLMHPVPKVTPADGCMVLSLMPYHELVRDTGRMMMINQENTDRKLTEAEESQMFGSGLKSALLVPVKVDDATLAVITMAEMRKWNRYQFTQADILFATSVAGVLSLAIRLSLRERSAGKLRLENQMLAGGSHAHPEIKGRVKSSLSGIMGSVEILRGAVQPSDSKAAKYLSIIDKSAQRINECLLEEGE